MNREEEIARARNWIKAGLAAIVVPLLLRILNEAFNGIVGEAAIALWEKVWAVRRTPIVVSPIWLIGMLLLVLVLAWRVKSLWNQSKARIVALEEGVENTKREVEQAVQERSRVQSALAATEELLDLDDDLMHYLSEARPTGRWERSAKQLLQLTLESATAVFGPDVSRAIIYMPDDAHDYLVPWVCHQMPTASMRRNRFFIGRDKDNRGNVPHGIAGKVYGSRRLVVVHFNENGEPDDSDYALIYNQRPHLPYRSFVAVPALSTDNKCLGVLCFDSMNPTVFDGPEVQDLLIAIARRCARVVAICHNLINDQRPVDRRRK